MALRLCGRFRCVCVYTYVWELAAIALKRNPIGRMRFNVCIEIWWMSHLHITCCVWYYLCIYRIIGIEYKYSREYDIIEVDMIEENIGFI